MTDTKITPPAGTIHISPYGFHRYASEFAKWGKQAHAAMGGNFSPVPYYLTCRSLELVLKALLLTKGMTQRELIKRRRELGHNLSKVLLRAKQLGLEQVVPLTRQWEAEVAKANDYYKDEVKGFEYFEIGAAGRGYPDLPDLNVLNELVSTLLTNLKRVCLDAA